ncbi:hypothetical protein MKX07_006461 [Trichoderma sp. CBMAI-0711]|nr:hypothetical protein MKX07_006461 [Trichoderma sp. CBMAI-0711]
MARLVDMPHTMKQIMVLRSPRMSTGFLPKVSDALPQGTAVMLWQTEKTEDVTPAHFATSSRLTPKPRIISGRYGQTEV